MMGQTLAVYGVVALLLVAGSGPALQAVRDGSLGDFEDLDEYRSLEEFPFLKEVRPYLPPLVVDWIIVQHDGPSGLPDGVDYRFDDDGRVIIVWPDGCEETEAQYRDDSRCDGPPAPDCTGPEPAPECAPCGSANATAEACPPPECPAGHVVHPEWPHAGPACVPDPQCDDGGNGTRPAHCPPVPPPPVQCPEDTVAAYDGSCVPLTTQKLRHVVFRSASDETRVAVELKVPYENLSYAVRYEGFPSPGWEIRLYDATGAPVCFAPQGGSGDCYPEEGAGGRFSGSGTVHYVDTVDGAIQPVNLTLFIRFDEHPAAGSSALEVRLYGKALEVGNGTRQE